MKEIHDASALSIRSTPDYTCARTIVRQRLVTSKISIVLSDVSHMVAKKTAATPFRVFLPFIACECSSFKAGE